MPYLNEDRKKVITECIINNKRVHYHVCATCSLEEAKAFYSKTKYKTYIGSGNVIFYNGKKEVSKKEHHFFVI